MACPFADMELCAHGGSLQRKRPQRLDFKINIDCKHLCVVIIIIDKIYTEGTIYPKMNKCHDKFVFLPRAGFPELLLNKIGGALWNGRTGYCIG